MPQEAHLLHDLVFVTAQRRPDAAALHDGTAVLTYAELAREIGRFANALAALGVSRGERVGIYLDKRRETVVASFGAPARGAVFVPINPILKAPQVGHILRDCNVRVLVTSPERLQSLGAELAQCHDLRHVVLTAPPRESASLPCSVHAYADVMNAPAAAGSRVIDNDVVGILYTSGSTGKPKGVVLAHRNMVAGAKSVASYLGNHEGDVLLAALPLSFDAGFSQLTTAFFSGAQAVLLNYLLPKDVVSAVARHRITGLTAVPPLWIQLTQATWPEGGAASLRYFANTGGRMPRDTLQRLRALFPQAKPYLMYGLTEAFRATYLPPEEVDNRPDSIGKAIPNSEILVLRPDGTECAADEPGELVQRGALVALGYWNDAVRTAERFKPLPGAGDGLPLPEYAVFSGDTVRRDAQGFLYFIGRRDEMIKSSGYRISPTEVEEILYASGLVGECAAFGMADAAVGEVVVVALVGRDGQPLEAAAVQAHCRAQMPAYMVPGRLFEWSGPLPRNANGKIDRRAIVERFSAGVPTGNAAPR